MNYENIIYEKEGNVGIIILNRPEKLNAFTIKMFQEVSHAIGEVAADDDIRALVITGAGRGFSAGDDLRDMDFPTDIPYQDVIRQMYNVMYAGIRNLRKPVIAAVNGNAHGVGLSVALICDFRIASEDVKFADLRIQGRADGCWGGNPGAVARLVGLGKVLEFLLIDETIDGREAERIGLINKTVPADRFKDEVMKFANRLAQGPTKVIGMVKARIYRELDMDLATALEDELTNSLRPDGKIEDREEGMRSFLEKRPPRFTGR